MKRTIGVQFLISVEDLAHFLEFLRISERYYNVEAVRITNPYLLTSPPPPVTVDMLLTVGWFNANKFENESTAASASCFSSASDALNQFGIRSREGPRVVQPSGFVRWWRNFRKRFLPF